MHASVFTEGVYSRDRGRGNRRGGGGGGLLSVHALSPLRAADHCAAHGAGGGGGRLQKTRRTP